MAKKNSSLFIENADIDLSDPFAPYSKLYNDLYFSKQGAEEESDFVFLKGNNLEERFSNLAIRESFSIAELGFGFGINFLNTWRLWVKRAPKDSLLNYFAIENNPVSSKDLESFIMKNFSSRQLAKKFLSKYPLNSRGWHRIFFSTGSVNLTIAYNDVVDSLNSLSKQQTKFDAFFLDGFSPKKNSLMWSKKIFKNLGELSHNKTSLSTFSSAELVKLNIGESSFSVNQSKGFGNKKYMLKGLSKISFPKKEKFKRKRIGIIGGGLSGSSLARLLSQRGHEIIVFDKTSKDEVQCAIEPAFILYPRLTAFNNAYSKFSLHSFIYSAKFYEDLQSEHWHKTGVFIINHDEQTLKRQTSLIEASPDGTLFKKLNSTQASEITGVNVNQEGLFFPQAGWLNSKGLCESMLKHRNISFKKEKVIEISEKNEAFHVNTRGRNYKFDELCLCTSHNITELINVPGISSKRGQITLIDKHPNLENLKVPICAKGYVSPSYNNIHTVGSTYTEDRPLKVLAKDHEENLTKLNSIVDGKYLVKDGWVGKRATTKDYLPITGKIKNFYINVGHGSKGTANAPFCSQYIADLIDNMPVNMDSELTGCLSPERFIS